LPAGRLDAHAATRPRLLPPRPIEPGGWDRSVPPHRDVADPRRGPGHPDREQAPPEDGGDAPGAVARGRDGAALWIAGGGRARDPRPFGGPSRTRPTA